MENNMNFFPFLNKGGVYSLPKIAFEIYDYIPENYPGILKEYFSNFSGKPGMWAGAAREFKADMVCLKLIGCHPDERDFGTAQAVNSVKDVLENTDLPVIVIGTGISQKDNEILPAIANHFKGQNLILGCARQENYKEIVKEAKHSGGSIILEVPVDINLAKQLSILISEEGMPLDKIVIYNTSAALGYGFEYVYSIIERIRLAATSGDKFLSTPQLAIVSTETWKAKEATADFAQWGENKARYALWEAVGACGYLAAGADIVVMHHPEAIKAVRLLIDELTENN